MAEKATGWRRYELAATITEGIITIGSISGAAIVSLYGKFLLAAVLLFIGLLFFARFKRGRVKTK